MFLVVYLIVAYFHFNKVGQYNFFQNNNNVNPVHGARSVSPAPNTLPVTVTQPGHNHANSNTASEVPLPSEVPDDNLRSDGVHGSNDVKAGAAV